MRPVCRANVGGIDDDTGPCLPFEWPGSHSSEEPGMTTTPEATPSATIQTAARHASDFETHGIDTVPRSERRYSPRHIFAVLYGGDFTPAYHRRRGTPHRLRARLVAVGRRYPPRRSRGRSRPSADGVAGAAHRNEQRSLERCQLRGCWPLHRHDAGPLLGTWVRRDHDLDQRRRLGLERGPYLWHQRQRSGASRWLRRHRRRRGRRLHPRHPPAPPNPGTRHGPADVTGDAPRSVRFRPTLRRRLRRR